MSVYYAWSVVSIEYHTTTKTNFTVYVFNNNNNNVYIVYDRIYALDVH